MRAPAMESGKNTFELPIASWSKKFFARCRKLLVSKLQPRQRNGEPHLILLIALSFERNESQPLRHRELGQRSGHGGERRSLIVRSKESAQHPIQTRDAHGQPHARAGGVLRNRARKMRQPHAAGQREPRRHLELIFHEHRFQIPIRGFAIHHVRARAVVRGQSERTRRHAG